MADHENLLESNHPWETPDWVELTNRMLDSYLAFVAKQLISRDSALADSKKLFEAPFVVVAHGVEDDPLLSYGNQAALNLWKLPLSEFIGTPSRKTAEPMHRDERADLLKRTRKHGFINDYSGVRISSTGERFRIHDATVWNLVGIDGAYVGQAAAFANWTKLADGA